MPGSPADVEAPTIGPETRPSIAPPLEALPEPAKLPTDPSEEKKPDQAGPPKQEDPRPEPTLQPWADFAELGKHWREKTICQIAFELRPCFVALGEWLKLNPADATSRAWGLSWVNIGLIFRGLQQREKQANASWDKTPFHQTWAIVVQELRNDHVGQLVRQHLQCVRGLFAHNPEDWFSLVAVQSALEFLSSVEINFETRRWFGYQAELGLSTETSAGFSALAPLVGGITGKGTKGDGRLDGERGDSTGRGSIKPFLMPAIEIIQILLRAELPDQIPSVEQAIAAWRNGLHTDQELECLMRLNGCRPRDYWPLALASAWPFSPLEVTQLRRRGFMSDDAWAQNMRYSGVLQRWQADCFWELTRQIPPATDLVRFMVRDVEDRNVVERFQLHAEFNAKFAGNVERWAQQQGLSREVMLANWAAHWRLPGLNQAYECLHRLREDNLGPDDRHLVTSRSDIETLLAQDDLPPYWRERLIAISYSPLTRVDTQRMRMQGVLDYDGVVSAFRDLGYDVANARRLADFTELRRAEFLRGRPASKAFTRGEIDSKQLRAALARFKPTEKEIIDLVAELEALAIGKSRGRCVAAIRKRFVSGQYTADQAVAELVDYGLAASDAAKLSRQWSCERGSREKAATATTLCTWYAHNLITEADFRERLLRLGYSGIDATRIIGTCKETSVKRITERTSRDKQRSAKDQERAAALKEREEIAARRAELRAARQADREAAAESRRKRKLRKAAVELASVAGESVDDAAVRIEHAVRVLMDDWDLSQTEAEGLAIHAVEVNQDSPGEPFMRTVVRLAEAEEVFDAEPGAAGEPRTAPTANDQP